MADVTVRDTTGVEQCKMLEGVVVSDAMNKTIVVKVVRTYQHPMLGKTIRSAKQYHVHDESDQVRSGDVVRFKECRPLSKRKYMTLSAVVSAVSKGA
ncbi:30S ribosomal protein S17 [Candidatus Babeliales bacterium]|nr:30S ribosomal protein S17 [Candidatus Babeliales bacterium]